MADFAFTPQYIYDQTDGGLTIILSYYPQAEPATRSRNHKFSIRDEKTSSCTLKEYNGLWWVKDYGSGERAMTAIEVVMKEEALEFGKAIGFIAEKFNIISEKGSKTKPQFKYEKQVIDAADFDGKMTWETMPYSLAGMKTLFADNIWAYLCGKNLGEKEEKSDAVGLRNAGELCEEYHLKEILWYRKVSKDEKTTELKAYKASSTDTFPMFMFDEGQWQKFYMPKAQPYKRKDGSIAPPIRFFSTGKKPEHYMFGYQQCYNALDELKAKTKKEVVEEYDDDGNLKKKKEEKEKKLDDIIICTGGRDALNVAAMGYEVVWLNSETADFLDSQYLKIKGLAEKIYNLPDIDETGKREALKLGLQYLEIYTIYLPDELRKRYDMRGKPCKDVTDYFRYFKPFDFKNLIKLAYPLRFWDVDVKRKRDGTVVTKYNRVQYEYKPNNELIYNFLYRVGFGLMEMPSEKKGEMMVQIDGNVVRAVEYRHVNKYVKDFLKAQYADLDLINAFHRSPNFSESSMANLPYVQVSFEDFGRDFQYLFFENQAWKITAGGIETYEPKKSHVYVWEDEVIKHTVKKLDDFFTVKKDEQDNWDVAITNNENIFLNFLINSSRIHWRKELEDELDKLPKDEREGYLKRYAFSLDGSLLSYEERHEQKMVFLSKLLSFGYLLHRYKDPSAAFCVWSMDYNTDADIDASMGGTGKSMAYTSLFGMMKYEPFEGRNPKLTANPHVFENITEHTDLMLVDDAFKYFDFDYFFSTVTSFVTANPKGTNSFKIAFDKSPKLCVTSNFPPPKDDQSTMRRMWVTNFSDYYHKNPKGDYREERLPKDEFGLSLFSEFDEKQWNMYLNLMAQAVKLWLTVGKVDSSKDNLMQKMYLNQMGQGFHDWADVYFSAENGRLNENVHRYMAFEEYKRKYQATMVAQTFLGKMKSWCAYNKYVLNPMDLRNDKDKKRITAFVEKMQFQNGEWREVGKKESVEMIYIRTNTVASATLSEPAVVKDSWEDNALVIEARKKLLGGDVF